jgi:hypothetical protein
VSEWQDIGTAPKDGTRVQITDGKEIVIAKWITKRAAFQAYTGTKTVSFWQQDGDSDCCRSYGPEVDDPTHWQPLSALPGSNPGK